VLIAVNGAPLVSKTPVLETIKSHRLHSRSGLQCSIVWLSYCPLHDRFWWRRVFKGSSRNTASWRIVCGWRKGGEACNV